MSAVYRGKAGRRARTPVLLLAALLWLVGCSDAQEITVAMKDRVSARPKLAGLKVLVETPDLERRVVGVTDRAGVWVGEVPCFNAEQPSLGHRVSMTYQGQRWEQEFTTNRENCSIKRSIIFMWVKQGAPVM